MSVGRLTLGTSLDGFLWCFMPPCSSGIAVPYILLALNKYYGLSRKLRIINLHRYFLKLDVPVQ